MEDHFNTDFDSENAIDFEALERSLENDLDNELADLVLLEDELGKIRNPDALGQTILNVIWEQFLNQIAVIAGEDFIRDNNNLQLDLSPDAHIQTSENFKKGNFATHNASVDYSQRYDEWRSNFVYDENNNVVMNKTRSGREVERLVKGARERFDANRPKGSVKDGTDIDHTVSAAEIIRNPEMFAYMTNEQQEKFANSDANLYEMKSSWNRSKKDLPTDEWLDNPNSSDQKPKEIFTDLPEEELREKNKAARQALDEELNAAKQQALKDGVKSLRVEAFKMGGATLRAVALTLLAGLLREVIGKLIVWLKSKSKSFDTFIESIKDSIRSFFSNLKRHLINAAEAAVTTIVTAIVGPIATYLRAAWSILKQGYKSLKDAIEFLNNPANKNAPIEVKVLEVGKIIMAGISGAGAIVLGKVIEAYLSEIPVFAFQIPLLGSLASLIGILLGAIVAGIIGAIAIYILDTILANKMRDDIHVQIVEKGNNVIAIQEKRKEIGWTHVDYDREKSATNIALRHNDAWERIEESKSLFEENKPKQIDFGAMDSDISWLLGDS